MNRGGTSAPLCKMLACLIQLHCEGLKHSFELAKKKFSKVVKLCKNLKMTPQPIRDARLTPRKPSPKQTATPNSLLLLIRARYYNSQLGQFISRDPLGYVDGMSQYRAYFVPGGMDPSGLTQKAYLDCVKRRKCDSMWLRSLAFCYHKCKREFYHPELRKPKEPQWNGDPVADQVHKSLGDEYWENIEAAEKRIDTGQAYLVYDQLTINVHRNRYARALATAREVEKRQNQTWGQFFADPSSPANMNNVIAMVGGARGKLGCAGRAGGMRSTYLQPPARPTISNNYRPTPYVLSGSMVGRRVKHTFTKHGFHNTYQLTRQAQASGTPQGQWINEKAAEEFIASRLGDLANGPRTFYLPPGIGRQILPDGSVLPATKVRLVLSGSGVKTAYPLN